MSVTTADPSYPGGSNRAVRLWLIGAWAAHLSIVVVLTAVFAHQVENDQNIGAGPYGIALLTLGLPWSIPLNFVLTEDWGIVATSPVAFYAIAYGPAFVNIALHGLFSWRLSRRLQQAWD